MTFFEVEYQKNGAS